MPSWIHMQGQLSEHTQKRRHSRVMKQQCQRDCADAVKLQQITELACELSLTRSDGVYICSMSRPVCETCMYQQLSQIAMVGLRQGACDGVELEAALHRGDQWMQSAPWEHPCCLSTAGGAVYHQEPRHNCCIHL
jgi:hypothetical protein